MRIFIIVAQLSLPGWSDTMAFRPDTEAHYYKAGCEIEATRLQRSAKPEVRYICIAVSVTR